MLKNILSNDTEIVYATPFFYDLRAVKTRASKNAWSVYAMQKHPNAGDFLLIARVTGSADDVRRVCADFVESELKSVENFRTDAKAVVFALVTCNSEQFSRKDYPSLKAAQEAMYQEYTKLHKKVRSEDDKNACSLFKDRACITMDGASQFWTIAETYNDCPVLAMTDGDRCVVKHYPTSFDAHNAMRSELEKFCEEESTSDAKCRMDNAYAIASRTIYQFWEILSPKK